jgi:excisionase family DNA binding protein
MAPARDERAGPATGPPAAPHLMTVAEVAAWLRLHPWSVYELVKSGELPSRRVGPKRGKIVIDSSDVDAYWRRAGLVAPSPAPGALDRHRRPRRV